MIVLGSTVRDKISGFEGVAVGRTTYLFGCVRVEVTPNKCDSGKVNTDAFVFDEPQLEVIAEPAADLVPTKRTKVTHGPRDNRTNRRCDFVKRSLGRRLH